MTTITPNQTDVMPDVPMALEDARRRLRGGMAWFFWIAGLSVVNSVAMMSGSDWGFVIGLGITQVVDVAALALKQHTTESMQASVSAISLLLCLIIAAAFALCGMFGRRRIKWAILVGMGVYVCDALIFLVAMDFLGLAFHGLALFGLYGGYKACRELRHLEDWSAAMDEEPLAVMS